MSENEHQDLKDAIVDLAHQIQRMADKQDEMLDDVKKIKEAIYNPDQGLYARLRELESWKQTSSRMIWTLFTSVVGLIGAFILKNVSS